MSAAENTTLAGLIPSAASRAPTDQAIVDLETTLSWAEAATKTGRLSAALVSAGIGPGDRVGVHYRKSAEAFLAMHAVVQRGAIAVPLDPNASGDYLSSVAKQTGCSAVLTHGLCSRLAIEIAQTVANVSTVIGLDDTPPDLGPSGPAVITGADVAAMDAIDPVTVNPADPAYIITTSGSTGRPKGICHTHESALAYVRFKLVAYDFGPDDRISDIAPNHFDISTQALWVTPAIGACNIVVREQYQLFPASLAQLMAESEMTVFYGVPYLLTQLAARGSLADRDLSSLRWVLFGGEVMPASTLSALMTTIPAATFSNVYGPAEVNACAVHHLDQPPAPDQDIPIGGPVADTEIRLIQPDDPHRALAPIGEKGEVWVKSATMMAGYWDQPELDRRAIVSDADGDWYRTGDLAWESDDGPLVFAGRIDHQIKVRGYRVELEAIESAIEELPDVAIAVATAGRSDDGNDVIIAGLVPEEPAAYDDLDLAAVSAHCKQRLPTYACPLFWYQIASPPTTGSGKVDRRAIRGRISTAHDASSTAHESSAHKQEKGDS